MISENLLLILLEVEVCNKLKKQKKEMMKLLRFEFITQHIKMVRSIINKVSQSFKKLLKRIKLPKIYIALKICQQYIT